MFLAYDLIFINLIRSAKIIYLSAVIYWLCGNNASFSVIQRHRIVTWVQDINPAMSSKPKSYYFYMRWFLRISAVALIIAGIINLIFGNYPVEYNLDSIRFAGVYFILPFIWLLFDLEKIFSRRKNDQWWVISDQWWVNSWS